MNKLYFKQTVSYLKLADKKLGILVNFNTDNISSAIQRIANNI